MRAGTNNTLYEWHVCRRCFDEGDDADVQYLSLMFSCVMNL